MDNRQNTLTMRTYVEVGGWVDINLSAGAPGCGEDAPEPLAARRSLLIRPPDKTYENHGALVPFARTQWGRYGLRGWKAETGANAAAGTAGANVGTQFIDGIAVYQITESGLMASADISGTKYWKHKKLNR